MSVRWDDVTVRQAWTAYQSAGSLRATAPQFQVSAERLRVVFVRAGLMTPPQQSRATYEGCCPWCGNYRQLDERTGFCGVRDCASGGKH